MQIQDTNRYRHDAIVLGIVCLMLQLAVAPYIAIANGHPNFAFIFSATFALTVGGPTGVAMGFAAGIVYDLGASSPMGLMAFLLTLSSYILGIEARNKLNDDPGAALVNGLISCFAVSLLYGLAMLLTGSSTSFIDMILTRSLPSFFLTALFAIPFYLFYSRPQSSGATLNRSLGTKMPTLGNTRRRSQGHLGTRGRKI